MGDESTSLRLAAQRVLHDLTVQRLVQRVYEQRIISNVERGAYVECMIELVLRERHPAWRLTDTWDSWDLEDGKSGARIEIKQSAAWNPFSKKPGGGKFNIEPHSGYFARDGAWIPTSLQRHADLYVFAWHPEEDPDIADHRRPDQWTFFVVAEQRLPQETPLAKAIGVKALTRLTTDSCDDDGLAEVCDFDALATTVVRAVQVLESRRSLRAQQLATGV